MPSIQLFKVDDVNPPKNISKLSSKYRHGASKKGNMPPRTITGDARPPSGRVAVGPSHPVATAATAAACQEGNKIVPGITVGLVAPVGTLASAALIEDCADAHDPP